MISIRGDFTARRSEIDQYLDLLRKIEDGEYLLHYQGNYVNLPTTVKTTQKASAILLLYNIVESVVTKLLIRIHEVVISKDVGYFDLNDKIKDLTLVYFNSVIEKKQSFHDAVPFVQSLIGMLMRNAKFEVSYEEMEKHYSLYSGNLDSRKIKETFSKYGVVVRETASELQTIKNGRNKLAHGEVSFEEYGRELSIQQLSALKDATLNYLKNLIDEVEEYVNSAGYRLEAG
ncbi:MAE_28990/MAE_18760 family HEPN-like nuclease [Massilia niastensis]|uniref:MAE_28990/MAE_18760 family HEPN-like nuclease n=1 Tax=Massilia niastensis TaxID=544911 RepID=UPI0012EC1BA7|nr:MAE_28990/MAE_18760 family HEPN-like nuclease [Massilia niastensis]